MAKKKLLNEATVRRFMGLAGVQPNIVSNKLTEMYGMKKEEEHMEEGSHMDEDLYEEEEEEEEADAPAMGDMGDMGDEPAAEASADAGDLDMDQEQAQGIVDAIRALQPLADDLEAELGGEAGEEDDLGDAKLDAEDDMGDMGDEPPAAEDEDMLEGVELELSEDEIVQEVAKRVAKRILKAKRAKSQLDEALGRTKTKR
jgi:hypothetical protein